MQLYDKLCQVLLNNKLDELGLLDVLPDVTDLPEKSQPFYPLIALDSKLGLSYPSIVTLLKEAHEKFISLDMADKASLELVTRIMIILKPENYTAMNRRKDMILNGYIDPNKELELIELIFTIPKHAKSPIAWHHRQWLLEHFSQDVTIDIHNELDLCKRACTIYPKNYYAWTFRSWLISEKCKSSPEIVNKEYETSKHWVELNISDYSGVQHLQRVMEYININILDHTNWLDSLIKRYPGHESLWCHKRFCSSFAMRMLDNWSPYCLEQHQFIKNVYNDHFKSDSFSESKESQVLQKELALRFGVWQTLLEKKSGVSIKSDLMYDDYRKIAPYFLNL